MSFEKGISKLILSYVRNRYLCGRKFVQISFPILMWDNKIFRYIFWFCSILFQCLHTRKDLITECRSRYMRICCCKSIGRDTKGSLLDCGTLLELSDCFEASVPIGIGDAGKFLTRTAAKGANVQRRCQSYPSKKLKLDASIDIIHDSVWKLIVGFLQSKLWLYIYG